MKLVKLSKQNRVRMRAISRWLRGKGVMYRRDVRCPTEWHGGYTHGWAVSPRDVGRNSVVYSLGVGKEISFDLSMIAKYGVEVHAFDPTPGTAEWLAEQSVPAQFRYHAYAISDRDGSAEFFAPVEGRKCHTLHERVPDQASAKVAVPVRRLRTIMAELGHRQIDILKMDIEGSEYEVIDDLIRERLPVRQLLIEFHHRFPTIGVARTRAAVRALREHGFRIFWASDSRNEYGFIRN